MMYKCLGDVATYVNGYPFKPEDRGKTGLPIIRIQDLTGNAYDLGFYDGEYPSRIEINDGDVLISWSASLGVYVWNRGRALLNQHIFKVVFDKTEVDKQYFVYAVQYKLKEMEAKTHGATMKHIIKKDFDNTLIPFPDLREQRSIADKLSCVEKVIAKRSDQLKKLDELMKARFVEMFGNFVYERDRWSTCKIGDISDTIDPQPSHRTPSVSLDGIPYIGIAECNYKTLQIDFANARKVGQDVLQEHLNRYTLDKGDFIIGKIGTIGKPFFLPVKQTYTLSANTVLIKPNKLRVEPQFLFAVFQSEYMERIIDAEKKSTSQPAFGIQKVRKIDIPMPPLELQQQFAAFVEQADKSKAAVQKSLDETQVLFDSLMQKYFG